MGQLVEVNAHSLFSKWFSESGKLVSRLFAKISELVRCCSAYQLLANDACAGWVAQLTYCMLSCSYSTLGYVDYDMPCQRGPAGSVTSK